MLVKEGGGCTLQILHQRDRLRVSHAVTSVELMVICCYQRVLENKNEGRESLGERLDVVREGRKGSYGAYTCGVGPKGSLDCLGN